MVRPLMMTLSKRHAVTMQRQWRMDEEEPQPNGESGAIANHLDHRWDENLQVNVTPGESIPTVSFETAEENTIELLVVVTRKMHLILKGRLTEYLVATIGSVGHSSY